MAGHSHWAGIKHKKALVDSKRGKLWSKLSKAIIVAAKMGGGDLDANPRLRVAVDAAKAVSMPKDNIQRAIKKGTGELESEALEEALYEGYGPSGVAVLCEVLTDNRNRTAGELRKIFEVHDGKMASAGSVAWMFDRKGLCIVPIEGTNEERLMEVALEAGADDVRASGKNFEIVSDPSAFQAVSSALRDGGFQVEVAELSWMPQTTVDLDADTGRKVLRLLERLDDHEDVQGVAANFNIPEEAMAEMAQE